MTRRLLPALLTIAFLSTEVAFAAPPPDDCEGKTADGKPCAEAGAVTPEGAAATESGEGEPLYIGRMEIDVRDSAPPAGITTVDQEQMRLFQRTDVGEALELVPGVTAANFGARNESVIYVRGFHLRSVPLYIDGIPVYVPYDGYVDLARFLTFDLSELRVSKGTTSVLNGPNTMGGSINLVSFRPTGTLEGRFSLGYGDGDMKSADAALGTRHDSWYALAVGALLEAEDWPLSDDFRPTARENGGDRDNSYNEDQKLGFTLGFGGGESSEHVLRYIDQEGEKGNPVYAGTDPLVRPRFWQWPEWNKESFYYLGNMVVGSDTSLRARAYYDAFDNLLSSFDSANYFTQALPSSFNSIFDDFTRGGMVEGMWSVGEVHGVRLAAHYKEDVHREHNVGEPIRHFEDVLYSAAGEYTAQIGTRWSFLAAIGYDQLDNELAEELVAGSVRPFPTDETSSWNPQVVVAREVGSAGRVHASASRRTRLPTMKDRYSYRMGRALPNPFLEPEDALSFEVGYAGPVGGSGLSLETNVFAGEVDDLIEQVFVAPNVFQLQNVGDSSNSGFEVALRTSPTRRFGERRLGAEVQYGYLDRTGGDVLPALDTPDHSAFGALIVRPFERLRLVASGQYESSRLTQNEGGSFREVDDYVVAALSANLTLFESLELEVAAKNALDEDYALTDGYPEPGQTLEGRVRYRF